MTRPTPQQGAWPLPMSLVGTLAVLAALLVLSLALATRAEAFIYWTNGPTAPCDDEGFCSGPVAIGRANLDGTGVSQRFIDVDSRSAGVAVDAEHIYWTASCPTWVPCSTGAIGRAKLDGAGVDERFITTGPQVGGIAVDADHIYWGEKDRIGRANLDGTGADPDFITTGGCPGDVAVGADHVYWTNICDSSFYAGAVGRADLDGTNVNPSFIPGDRIGGVAVDANHVYWANSPDWGEAPYYPPAIGRANLDGTEIDRRFIASLAGPGDAYGLEVDATHIYWGQSYSAIKGGIVTWISRATIDGTLDSSFHIGTAQHADLAVDALTDTELMGDVTAARSQKQHGDAVVVKVKVSAHERLTAEASGKIKVPSYKLKPKQVELSAGEAITLKLKPKKAQKREIAAALRRGSSTAKLTVTLTDFAGNSEVEKLRVRLKR